MFTGVIGGVGPRYCPSIEDKIHRFADKDQHQIFVEPEGLTTHELYPNGISTSLPFDIQLALVQDTRVPMWMAVLSYWLIGIPMSYVLAFPLGFGGVGLWFGLVIGLACAGALMMTRFWRGPWLAPM